MATIGVRERLHYVFGQPGKHGKHFQPIFWEFASSIPARAKYFFEIGHILTQTPNATRNEAEFDRSRFSMRTKMTNICQKQPVNILKPLLFVCR